MIKNDEEAEYYSEKENQNALLSLETKGLILIEVGIIVNERSS